VPRWATALSSGVGGGAVGLLLGGDFIVAGIAFAAAVVIDTMQRLMSRRRLPGFYQQVAGGLIATAFALAATAANLPVDPSLVISADLVMLLSGIGFMGAIQDALTGFPITAGARALEVVLATSGIIAGVSGGLGVGRRLGVDITQLDPGVGGFSYLPVMAFGAAVAAAAFAFASYAPVRSLLPIAFVAALGEIIAFAVQDQDVGRAWATAMAALAIGLVSHVVASRFHVPPLVVVVSAVSPLLPGLTIYRGLSLMANGDSTGTIDIVAAAAIAISLASGVLLGEYLAQPLRREAHRLETRLSGPRLVGPLRAPSRRRH
jgi:uncharacterized membrane protein YjjB (DUF3815 family)